MNKILEMIKAFLESDSDNATDFSIELEDALCDRHDQMAAENKEAAEILNEELPDICADYEFGEDIQAFKDKVRTEYEKAMKAMA